MIARKRRQARSEPGVLAFCLFLGLLFVSAPARAEWPLGYDDPDFEFDIELNGPTTSQTTDNLQLVTATDADKNTFVAGNFVGTAAVNAEDGNAATRITVDATPGEANAFVVSVDRDSRPRWLTQLRSDAGSGGELEIRGLAVSPPDATGAGGGELYVTGYYRGGLWVNGVQDFDFDPTAPDWAESPEPTCRTSIPTAGTARTAFLLKLTADGERDWCRNLGYLVTTEEVRLVRPTFVTESEGQALAVDDAGNVVVAMSWDGDAVSRSVLFSNGTTVAQRNAERVPSIRGATVLFFDADGDVRSISGRYGKRAILHAGTSSSLMDTLAELIPRHVAISGDVTDSESSLFLSFHVDRFSNQSPSNSIVSTGCAGEEIVLPAPHLGRTMLVQRSKGADFNSGGTFGCVETGDWRTLNSSSDPLEVALPPRSIDTLTSFEVMDGNELWIGGTKQDGVELELFRGSGAEPIDPGTGPGDAFIVVIRKDTFNLGDIRTLQSSVPSSPGLVFAKNGGADEVAVLADTRAPEQAITSYDDRSVLGIVERGPADGWIQPAVAGVPDGVVLEPRGGRIASMSDGGYVVAGRSLDTDVTRFYEDWTGTVGDEVAAVDAPTGVGSNRYSNRLFLARLSGAGAWNRPGEWRVGEPILVPGGADPLEGINLAPTVSPASEQGKFTRIVLEDGTAALVPLQPVEGVAIRWAAGDTEVTTDDITTVGSVSWPEDPVLHIQGAAVDVASAQMALSDGTMIDLSFTPTGSDLNAEVGVTISGGVLTSDATSPGSDSCGPPPLDGNCRYSVLVFAETNTANPRRVEVVRHVPPNLALPVVEDDCIVGTPIPPDSSHDASANRNGAVLFATSPYDGEIYDASTGVGPIIPVNRSTVASSGSRIQEEDLRIAWYQRSNQTGVHWPGSETRHDCRFEATVILNQAADDWGTTPDARNLVVSATALGLQVSDGASVVWEAPLSGADSVVVEKGLGLTTTVSSFPAEILRFERTGGPGGLYDWTAGEGATAIGESTAGPFEDVWRLTTSTGDEIEISWSSALGVDGYQIVAESGRIQAAIENGLGSAWRGFELDPAIYANPTVYHQPDPSEPGFNPNDEHALILVRDEGGFPAVYPLRNRTGEESEPYILVRYVDPATTETAFLAIEVLTTQDGADKITYDMTAGRQATRPFPLDRLGGCAPVVGQPGQTKGRGSLAGLDGEGNLPSNFFEDTSVVDAAPFYLDRNGDVWASAAGVMEVEYFYPISEDFYLSPINGAPPLSAGQCMPFLGDAEDLAGDPSFRSVRYVVSWPELDDPSLGRITVGQSILEPEQGVPDIWQQPSIKIAFDEVHDGPGADPDQVPRDSLVQLIEAVEPRVVENADAVNAASDVPLENLPADLADRFFVDEAAGQIGFRGVRVDPVFGSAFAYLNVMSVMDRDRLHALAADADPTSNFRAAVDDLFYVTRNPRGIDTSASGSPDELGDPDNATTTANAGTLIGYAPAANPVETAERVSIVGGGGILSAGAAAGTGWVTLVANDDPSLSGIPVEMYVVRVDCGTDGGPAIGRLDLLTPSNVFDERQTLTQTLDFGGLPERYAFDWFRRPDDTGRSPAPPTEDPTGWSQETVANPGGLQLTLEGGGLRTLGDNWVYSRYRSNGTTPAVCTRPVVPADPNSSWAGAASGTALQPLAQLAEGWIKRVIRGINVFDQRVRDYHVAPTQTQANIVQQAGERYRGDIAFSDSADNLNSIGLIETYTTVLERGARQSIDRDIPVDAPAINSALLFAASRVSDLYMLLGNEAYADALDPTIALGTSSVEFGNRAPAIFAFQNQQASLIDEELGLLRGIDEGSDVPVLAHPVYNRLPWNFTSGDGEIAYKSAYHITDITFSGSIDVEDAAAFFPQAHGDAWGHYLTAIKTYYRLLRDESFTWEPRTESVSVGGEPVHVDFLDERNFAQAAAAKARAGAEIVDLTYRKEYTGDPAGQWQGYTDTDLDRAWGVQGWARRAGQAAYFDWLTANAILPAEDPEGADDGIEKIDRSTVPELGNIVEAYAKIEAELGEADRGLNPLGLAPGVVPFDISAAAVDLFSDFGGQTHFDQIAERALVAMENAVRVYDHANELSQALRLNQDTTDDFAVLQQDVEIDAENRLVEIFGTPYSDDIGGGQFYPTGYDGPDLVFYNIVDGEEFTGLPEDPAGLVSITAYYEPISVVGFFPGDNVVIPDDPGSDSWDDYECDEADCLVNPENGSPVRPVDYSFEPEAILPIPSEGGRTGSRRAPGEIQFALQDLLRARLDFQQSREELDAQLTRIGDKIELVQLTYDTTQEQLDVLTFERLQVQGLNTRIQYSRNVANAYGALVDQIDSTFDVAREAIPKVVGLSNDPGAPARSGLVAGQFVITGAIRASQAVQEGEALDRELDKDVVALTSAIRMQSLSGNLELAQAADELNELVRQLPALEVAVADQEAALRQAFGRYRAVLEEGTRVLDDLVTYRRTLSGTIADIRYQDAAFRIFRNDALQKYRASFDLAARYVYLAATAYDYETNLLGTDSGSGRTFLTSIVKERSLGHLIDGVPIVGTPGLADTLGRLSATYAVLAPQFGFNNPDTETNRFSLRRELFRICRATESECAEDDPDRLWRETLESHRVDDLWAIPEYRRYARPFAPEFLGAQPGIVIPFSTTVTAGLNFFGQELGPGDSAYDASLFSTKVRSVGTWFTGYDLSGLANTPRVYLIPTGMDILRSPDGFDFTTREWKVVDQKLPVPFPIGSNDLIDPSWIPQNDSLLEELFGVRRFSSYRAYHVAEDDVSFADPTEMTSSSRLVGRSVWNTEWLLIIPGQQMLFDADQALDTFIRGDCDDLACTNRVADAIPDTQDGISDIQLFFQTYSFSGN